MFGNWLRQLIATSIYREILSCKDCEKADNGFDSFHLCKKHENHIDFHNILTSINAK